MSFFKRIVSLLLCYLVIISVVSGTSIAKAVNSGPLSSIPDTAIGNWMGNSKGFIEILGRDIEIEWPWGGKILAWCKILCKRNSTKSRRGAMESAQAAG